MTYWGIMRDGAQMLLGDPKEMVLCYDRGAPAHQLKAVFPADRLWEDLSRVVVYDGGVAVFRGIVDEQNTRLDTQGIWVELVCRSLEAILLDNEACPAPIRDPSLKALGNRLLKPLGFQEVVGEEEPVRGLLEIEKGASCWQVLAGFCGRYLGTEPYVDPEGVLHCEGLEEQEETVQEVLWAEVSRRPCKELSQVWQQSFRGAYDTLYRDPDAMVERRRYLSSQSGADPKGILRKAKQESFCLTVECAGLLWPAAGKVLTVELPGLGKLARCPVQSARCYQDGKGKHTRLVLGKGEEVCG